MELTNEQYKALLKAYLNFTLSNRVKVNKPNMKLRPVKTTKYSLSSLENLPSDVKDITLLRKLNSDGSFDIFVSIRTEETRFSYASMEEHGTPNDMANNTISLFKEGRLKQCKDPEYIARNDNAVEKGIFEMKCSNADAFEFFYYV